jgi:heme exporter protein C
MSSRNKLQRGLILAEKKTIRNSLLFWLGVLLMAASLYMVFIFVPTERTMGAVQRIFYFHVPLAWNGFLAFGVVFVFSIMYLRTRDLKWDNLARASAEVGMIFTSLVLVTGVIWAKPIWGVWWTWDPRLTATLVLWLIYFAYLMVRGYTYERSRGARFAAVLGIIGFVDVPIAALAINLWRTQHPPALVFEGGLTPPMLATMLVAIAAFTIVYVLLAILRNEQLKAELELEAMKRDLELREDGR